MNQKQEDESAQLDERITQISVEISKFVGELAEESERSAVVLGAARLDVSLEKLLKGIMHHHPDGNDNLFDPDRPLGTFSAKIALAYRLGLIDGSYEHALQMIRRIRNDFAHSTSKSSLSVSPHKNRVDELVKEVSKHGFFSKVRQSIAGSVSQPVLLHFCTAITILIIVIETALLFDNSIEAKYVCTLG
jgi:hypothetical protein